MAMSKTAAIDMATRRVQIQRFGSGWQVIGPYRYSQPSGPTTSVNVDSYEKARTRRAKWAANVAILAMGLPADSADDIEAYFHGYCGGGNDMRGAVEYAISRHTWGV